MCTDYIRAVASVNRKLGKLVRTMAASVPKKIADSIHKIICKLDL